MNVLILMSYDTYACYLLRSQDHSCFTHRRSSSASDVSKRPTIFGQTAATTTTTAATTNTTTTAESAIDPDQVPIRAVGAVSERGDRRLEQPRAESERGVRGHHGVAGTPDHLHDATPA